MASGAQIINGTHRSLLITYIRAKEVLQAFQDEKKPLRDRPLLAQDHARYGRTKYLEILPMVIGKIKPSDHHSTFPIGLLGPIYDAYGKSTVQTIVEEAGRTVQDLQATLATYPPNEDPSSNKQYWGASFRSLAVTSVPVGHTVLGPEQKSYTVFAYMDANGAVHFVNSSSQHVRREDVMFFERVTELDFEKEIEFRRQVSMALNKASIMSPRPATYAEIYATHEDLTKVPILLSELGKLGQLGGVTQDEKRTFAEEARGRLRKHQGPIMEFLKVIKGDERACLALLVRAIATLEAVSDSSPEAKTRLAEGLPDRWIWAAMKKVANFSMEKLTFNLNIGSGGWVDWVLEHPPMTDVSASGDTFFHGLQNDLLVRSLWADLVQICPVAAHRPLDPPMAASLILRKGILAGVFMPDLSRRNAIRYLRPLWTTHYSTCMDDLFPPNTKQSRPPTRAEFPPILPSYVRKETKMNFLSDIYMYWLRKYADGRPEGATYIILQWLHELYKALVLRNEKRFIHLINLRERWEKANMLMTSAETTGNTAEHSKHLREIWARSTGQTTANDTIYTHKSQKARLKEAKTKTTDAQKQAEDEMNADGGKKKKRKPRQASDKGPAVFDTKTGSMGTSKMPTEGVPRDEYLGQALRSKREQLTSKSSERTSKRSTPS